ncbi:MAG: class I SAM-dependent methyltransferase [Trueperaceae bacterium]
MARWDDPDTVAFFASRPPDHRLVALVEAGGLPCGARVLDLGCAGGRNTAYLTGLDVEAVAVDAEPAMVAATRARVAPFVGPEEAARRVRVGRFDALAELEDEGFELVLALGVLQNATGDAEFTRGVRELARVLRPGGTALVAHFSPASRPPDRALARVAGAAHAYRGFFGEDPELPMVLHDAGELDAAFAAAGLTPVVPSDTVIAPAAGDGSHRDARRRAAGGTRVTINAHYRKPPTR